MSNRIDVASNSTPSFPRVIGTTTNDRTMRRKNKWTCLAVIGSIIIITAIVVPITIIKTSEDNKIARNTTIKTGANGTTPKAITEKTATTPKAITEKTATTPKPITETTTTTTTTTIFDDNENITTIQRLKYFDYFTQQTRYWYQLASITPGSGWTEDKIIFRAYTIQMPGTERVHFYTSGSFNSWYNTLSMDPMPSSDKPNEWDLYFPEVTLYCYRTSIPSEKLQPIRRFWSPSNVHLRNNISKPMYLLTAEMEDEVQPGWEFDKILMYALPPE